MFVRPVCENENTFTSQVFQPAAEMTTFGDYICDCE